MQQNQQQKTTKKARQEKVCWRNGGNPELFCIDKFNENDAAIILAIN
jgi:hypothetical protein